MLFGLWALSLFGMVSCVDNDYDLSKDIDMSVTVGGNDLTIPASDTKTLHSKKSSIWKKKVPFRLILKATTLFCSTEKDRIQRYLSKK